MWTDTGMVSGSVAANNLVTQQRANRMVTCAKAIMAAPEVILGLMFMKRRVVQCNLTSFRVSGSVSGVSGTMHEWKRLRCFRF